MITFTLSEHAYFFQRTNNMFERIFLFLFFLSLFLSLFSNPLFVSFLSLSSLLGSPLFRSRLYHSFVDRLFSSSFLSSSSRAWSSSFSIQPQTFSSPSQSEKQWRTWLMVGLTVACLTNLFQHLSKHLCTYIPDAFFLSYFHPFSVFFSVPFFILSFFVFITCFVLSRIMYHKYKKTRENEKGVCLGGSVNS